jgi:hypothetical protein
MLSNLRPTKYSQLRTHNCGRGYISDVQQVGGVILASRLITVFANLPPTPDIILDATKVTLSLCLSN